MTKNCIKCGNPKDGHPTRSIEFQGRILTSLYHDYTLDQKPENCWYCGNIHPLRNG